MTLLHVSIRCVLLHILTFMTVDRSYLASERGRFRLAAAVCATVKCEPPNSTRIVRNICELTSVIHWLNWVFLAAAKCLKNDEHLTELSVLSVLSSVCYSDVTWRRGFDYFCVLHMFWLLFSDLRMRFIALFICFSVRIMCMHCRKLWCLAKSDSRTGRPCWPAVHCDTSQTVYLLPGSRILWWACLSVCPQSCLWNYMPSLYQFLSSMLLMAMVRFSSGGVALSYLTGLYNTIQDAILTCARKPNESA